MFHYVDDFVIVGPPGSNKCDSDLGLLMQTCADLGVIIVEDITEGSSTCLTILGVEFDSLAMELRRNCLDSTTRSSYGGAGALANGKI